MAKDHSTDKTSPTTNPADFGHFYHHFMAFHERCAFLCEATACIAGQSLGFDDPTIAGIQQQCYEVKHKARDLAEELKQMQRADRSRRKPGKR